MSIGMGLEQPRQYESLSIPLIPHAWIWDELPEDAWSQPARVGRVCPQRAVGLVGGASAHCPRRAALRPLQRSRGVGETLPDGLSNEEATSTSRSNPVAFGGSVEMRPLAGSGSRRAGTDAPRPGGVLPTAWVVNLRSCCVRQNLGTSLAPSMRRAAKGPPSREPHHLCLLIL